MKVLRAELGFLPQGSRVSIELSAPANVRLMVAECAVLNQFGYGYAFHGGLYPRGTVTITVPDDDHWVLVVDLEGLSRAVTVSPVSIKRARRRRFMRA
jgi:hypothetical protein